jgi:hypothetical protein
MNLIPREYSSKTFSKRIKPKGLKKKQKDKNSSNSKRSLNLNFVEGSKQ